MIIEKTRVRVQKRRNELASSTRLLRGILQRARGVGADSVGGIIDFYNEEPESQSPIGILTMIIGGML